MKSNEIKVNYKKLAVDNWKESNFSLFGVLNYIQKTSDKSLVTFCKEHEINRKELTIDSIKAKMTVRELNRLDKQGAIIEPRTRFSLWTALTSLSRK